MNIYFPNISRVATLTPSTLVRWCIIESCNRFECGISFIAVLSAYSFGGHRRNIFQNRFAPSILGLHVRADGVKKKTRWKSQPIIIVHERGGWYFCKTLTLIPRVKVKKKKPKNGGATHILFVLTCPGGCVGGGGGGYG